MAKSTQIAVGTQFRRLTVLRYVGVLDFGKERNSAHECQCECGKILIARSNSLLSGNTKSCGCVNRELIRSRSLKHGFCGTYKHSVWESIKQRIYNSKNRYFSIYGGRGIKMCRRWTASITDFWNDIGDRESPFYSVDRIDNNGHYSCGKCDECKANGWKMNVKWSTQREQQRNRRTNVWMEWNGQRLCMQDWSHKTGLSQSTISRRLKRGWNVIEALSTPSRRSSPCA